MSSRVCSRPSNYLLDYFFMAREAANYDIINIISISYTLYIFGFMKPTILPLSNIVAFSMIFVG